MLPESLLFSNFYFVLFISGKNRSSPTPSLVSIHRRLGSTDCGLLSQQSTSVQEKGMCDWYLQQHEWRVAAFCCANKSKSKLRQTTRSMMAFTRLGRRTGTRTQGHVATCVQGEGDNSPLHLGWGMESLMYIFVKTPWQVYWPSGPLIIGKLCLGEEDGVGGCYPSLNFLPSSLGWWDPSTAGRGLWLAIKVAWGQERGRPRKEGRSETGWMQWGCLA